MRSVRAISLAVTLAMVTAMPPQVSAGYVHGYTRKDGTYLRPALSERRPVTARTAHTSPLPKRYWQ